MSTLAINDLSVGIELDREAMVSIIGGCGHSKRRHGYRGKGRGYRSYSRVNQSQNFDFDFGKNNDFFGDVTINVTATQTA